jgi:hypothetical protein
MLPALHRLDIRLRRLNHLLLFSRKDRPHKNQVLDALFIPNAQMNGSYRLNSLNRFKIEFLSTNPSNPTSQVIASVQDTDPDASFSIAAGGPVRVSTNQKYFVMLWAHLKDPNKKFTYVIDDNKRPFVIKLSDKDEFNEQGTLNDLRAQLGTDPALHAQFNEAIRIIQYGGQDNGFVYCPAIIHASTLTSQTVVDNCSTGWGLSLVDLGGWIHSMGQRFPGSNVSSLDTVKEGQSSHLNGNAIDLTLLPYYLKNGIVLKNHNPYILSNKYLSLDANNVRAPVSHREHLPNRFVKTTTWDMGLGGATMYPIEGNAQIQAQTKAFLNSLIAASGAASVVSLEDFSDNDQKMYHFESNHEIPSAIRQANDSRGSQGSFGPRVQSRVRSTGATITLGPTPPGFPIPPGAPRQ